VERRSTGRERKKNRRADGAGEKTDFFPLVLLFLSSARLLLLSSRRARCEFFPRASLSSEEEDEKRKRRATGEGEGRARRKE